MGHVCRRFRSFSSLDYLWRPFTEQTRQIDHPFPIFVKFPSSKCCCVQSPFPSPFPRSDRPLQSRIQTSIAAPNPAESGDQLTFIHADVSDEFDSSEDSAELLSETDLSAVAGLSHSNSSDSVELVDVDTLDQISEDSAEDDESADRSSTGDSVPLQRRESDERGVLLLGQSLADSCLRSRWVRNRLVSRAFEARDEYEKMMYAPSWILCIAPLLGGFLLCTGLFLLLALEVYVKNVILQNRANKCNLKPEECRHPHQSFTALTIGWVSLVLLSVGACLICLCVAGISVIQDWILIKGTFRAQGFAEEAAVANVWHGKTSAKIWSPQDAELLRREDADQIWDSVVEIGKTEVRKRMKRLFGAKTTKYWRCSASWHRKMPGALAVLSTVAIPFFTVIELLIDVMYPQSYGPIVVALLTWVAVVSATFSWMICVCCSQSGRRVLMAVTPAHVWCVSLLFILPQWSLGTLLVIVYFVSEKISVVGIPPVVFVVPLFAVLGFYVVLTGLLFCLGPLCSGLKTFKRLLVASIFSTSVMLLFEVPGAMFFFGVERWACLLALMVAIAIPPLVMGVFLGCKRNCS